jgi:hypothetical protein
MRLNHEANSTASEPSDGFAELQATSALQDREAPGTGPHPSAFRYAFGSAVRCLYRAAWPSEPLSNYLHGLFDARVPLSLSLPLPDALDAAETIRAYAVVIVSPCCQNSRKCLRQPQKRSRSIGRRSWRG